VALTTVTSLPDYNSGFTNPVTLLKDTNGFTTVGAVAGVVTAGVGGAVALASEPELLVEGALLTGLFLYLGHKETKGEYFLPFLHSDEEKATKKAKSDRRRAAQAAKSLAEATDTVPETSVSVTAVPA